MLGRIAVLDGKGRLVGRHRHFGTKPGPRQRLAIARTLAIEPALIIVDEPLSGAAVSIRGQVLNLLLDIRDERGIAYLMITHDISIARAFADRVAVMKRGSLVESGPAEAAPGNPREDYTRRLVAAVPDLTSLPDHRR